MGIRKYNYRDKKEEEVMSKELVYEFCIPCVVQWCTLWFSAPTRLHRRLGWDLKTKEYNEAVDRAIAEAISGPFWVYTYSENVYVGIGGFGFVQNTQEIESE